ncbi:MAG: HNH endonuclease [Kosmotogaceae bacterium]|nr:HNH endonuclease [Kosmotogaceae bacterium]
MDVLALTDVEWFKYLREWQPPLINFWTPTAWAVNKINPGDLFYFFLKSPFRRVGGYATYVYSVRFTVADAWRKFSIGNGAASPDSLLERLRSINKGIDPDSLIGCIILKDAVYFSNRDFLTAEELGTTFANGIQKFKYLTGDSSEADIRATLAVRERLWPNSGSHSRKIASGAFRNTLFEIYGKCVITGTDYPLVLKAAHINTDFQEAEIPQNGLLLRSDINTLYEANLLTVDQHYRVKLSDILDNTSYEGLEGKGIYLPIDPNLYPSREALKKREEKLISLGRR